MNLGLYCIKFRLKICRCLGLFHIFIVFNYKKQNKTFSRIIHGYQLKILFPLYYN